MWAWWQLKFKSWCARKQCFESHIWYIGFMKRPSCRRLETMITSNVGPCSVNWTHRVPEAIYCCVMCLVNILKRRLAWWLKQMNTWFTWLLLLNHWIYQKNILHCSQSWKAGCDWYVLSIMTTTKIWYMNMNLVLNNWLRIPCISMVDRFITMLLPCLWGIRSWQARSKNCESHSIALQADSKYWLIWTPVLELFAIFTKLLRTDNLAWGFQSLTNLWKW